MKLSFYHVVSPVFFDERDERSKRAIFATRTANLRVIDEKSWESIGSGRFDELSPEILAELVDIEFLVPEDENELQTILDRNESARWQDDDLYLVVQPTAYCQLGCHYCGQSHSPDRLSEEDANRLLDRTREKLKTGRFKSLSIGWFGGEPLAGLPVIRSLTPKLQSLAAEFGCSYRAKIVTNGLALTPNIARELIEELKIDSIEITLDGTAEFHDLRRMQKNGHPTFEKIFTNLVNLAYEPDLNASLIVRCNVDRQNVESVSPLLELLAFVGLQERISFYVAPIHSWGNDADARGLSKEEFAGREIVWLNEMIELGFTPNPLPERVPIVCMALQPAAELVDARGNIFNCTEVSYVPAYGSPNRYAIDHLSGETMPGNREILGDFNEKINQGVYPCSTCRMLPVCGGSCPKSWLEGHPACPIAKYNIEQRLLLAYALSRLDREKPAPRSRPATERKGDNVLQFEGKLAVNF